MGRLALLVAPLAIGGAALVALSVSQSGRRVNVERPSPRSADASRVNSRTSGTLLATYGGKVERHRGPVPAVLSDLPLVRAQMDAGRDGRTSSLVVRVRRGDTGVPAEVLFLDGPNAGTRASGGPSGLLCPRLYPGLCHVLVRATGGPALRRELLLPHRQGTELSLDLGGARSFWGRVTDEQGRPLVGAAVTVEGRELVADRDGRFQAWVWPGATLVVRMPRFASFRQRLQRTTETTASRPYVVRLRRGCPLELELEPLAGEASEAQLYLFSAAGEQLTPGTVQPCYPWEDLYPLRGLPGERVRLEDLPPGTLEVRAFHPRAESRPLRLLLRPDSPVRAEVVWTPVPLLEGKILRGGVPERALSVELIATDPIHANAVALGRRGSSLRSQPIGYLPSARQGTTTDAAGRFRMGLWPGAGERLLAVMASDGEPLAVRRLGGAERFLIVELEARKR